MISEYFLNRVMYYISTVFIQGDRTAEFGGLDCSCENEYNIPQLRRKFLRQYFAVDGSRGRL